MANIPSSKGNKQFTVQKKYMAIPSLSEEQFTTCQHKKKAKEVNKPEAQIMAFHQAMAAAGRTD
ncbi:hypothetical protein CCACVL1_02168 [Corchorus capsularis]|uniref:Uncharacterized protein n=1 Tax=Corchorus capsularis TaxID=210143 RepID=A0A1R3KB93_COCAP|nr:hypothetical protein CCACVL1_02168 [Corchorus capsularis]